MAYENMFVVFIVSCTIVIQIAGQELCRPSRVDTLTLTDDSTLVWSPPSNNNCEISYYLVDIHNGTDTEYAVVVSDTALSLSFLPVCENYRFTVIPVSSQGVEGEERLHYAKMPLPRDANLSIALFSVATHEVGVYLEWELEDEWKKCADRYRLSIYDGESEAPADIYLYSNYVTISRLVPCTRYEFGIRAIYNMAIEGPFTYTYFPIPPAVTTAPKLTSITLGMTFVDLIWQMDSISENRCPVSSLTVDASPHFRISYPVRDQSSRTSFRTTVSGIPGDTMYFLNVTATNAAGTSPAALVAVQTLPIIID